MAKCGTGTSCDNHAGTWPEGAGRRAVSHPDLRRTQPTLTTASSKMNSPQSTSAGLTLRYSEKREAILAAAALAFNENGVKGATLADIAQRVGLIKTSVTYYYRRKEDLAMACFMQSIEAFQSMAKQVSAAPSISERIRQLFLRQAEMLKAIQRQEAPPLVRFDDLRALPEPLAEEVFGAYSKMFRTIRELLQGAETSGLHRQDLNGRTHIVLSVLLWQTPFLLRREPMEFQRLADQMADVVLHGIGGPGSSWGYPENGLAWSLSRKTSATTEAYLRAATELINEQGYRGASVEKIAARLNLTKGSFYHHHDTKDDVLSQCFLRSFDVVGQALTYCDAVEGPTWERLCAFASELVRFQLREGALLRMSAYSALDDSTNRWRVSDTLDRVMERLVDRVVDGLTDHSLRLIHPVVAANVLFVGVNAAAELRRWIPGATEASATAMYVRPLLMGVLCSAAN